MTRRTILILTVLVLSACGSTPPCPAGQRRVRCEYDTEGPHATVCAVTWYEAFERAHALLDRDGSAPTRDLMCEPL